MSKRTRTHTRTSRWAARHAAFLRDTASVLDAYTHLVHRARALLVALTALVVAATALAHLL
jgi:hypothetical protein